MTAIITHGDAANLLLPDESVDLIVTSPPYFGLRSYVDGGQHYTEQIGSEATPAEYLDALIACTREWMRVLKPGGSIFVNLGDKYSAYNGGRGQGTIQRNEIRQAAPRGHGLDVKTIPNKSLLLLPERYRIRAVDELGLIARAVLVWAKPNGLPESVKDRARRSHEDWVHLTKSPRYYSAIDAIREPHTMKPQRRSGRPVDTTPRQGQPRQSWSTASRDEPGPDGHPLGKLPGSVWTIPTQPLKVPAELGVDHFAAFPMEWPRRLILGWCPPEVCLACGEGRRPTIEAGGAQRHGRSARYGPTQTNPDQNHGVGGSTLRQVRERWLTGWACACADTSAPTTPGIVLDPFGGTGTTALVASAHGRIGISNDLSADYCRLARWRTTDAKQRARAGKPQPPPRPDRPAPTVPPARPAPAPPEDTLALFDDDAPAA